MIDHKGAAALWEAFLATLPEHERAAAAEPQVWAFGDSPELADELIALVLQGIKTATADLVWTVEYEARSVPQPGEYNVVLDGAGDALCIMQTTAVDILPYEDVPAAFAYDEGEGDRSLAYWRDAHWRYFSRRCAEMGRDPTMTMPVICEHFRVVYKAAL
ncbi:MAG: ASCH domain-containing protein [Chloroflexi bacterium]|nr:ASCH domain-containing protein [Chloroflexota bacterium]MCC6892315.1 ASCH domain-containing protein [Anaerolineae bacterium]